MDGSWRRAERNTSPVRAGISPTDDIWHAFLAVTVTRIYTCSQHRHRLRHRRRGTSTTPGCPTSDQSRRQTPEGTTTRSPLATSLARRTETRTAGAAGTVPLNKSVPIHNMQHLLQADLFIAQTTRAGGSLGKREGGSNRLLHRLPRGQPSPALRHRRRRCPPSRRRHRSCPSSRRSRTPSGRRG